MRSRLVPTMGLRLLTSLLLAATTLACATPTARTRLDLLYNPAASHHGPDRNPIIVIPGILGSALLHQPSKAVVWGAFEPGALDPGEPEGARIIALSLDPNFAPTPESGRVEPNGVLEKVRINFLGVPLEVQAYAGILATLGAGGYRDRALGLAGEVDYGEGHFTCFQFAYDWRKGNEENAKLFHEFILKRREEVRAEYKRRFGIDKTDIKFDIAAHSMGGLMTRYFLRYGSQDLPADGSLPDLNWAGAEYVERVVFVAPPNAGSLDALLELVRGRSIGPLLPFFPASLLGTYPSVYQLLPRVRHQPTVWQGAPDRAPADLFDVELWKELKWGLADPEEEGVLEVLLPGIKDADARRKMAHLRLAHLLKRAEQFQAALDRPASPPAGLDLRLVAGNASETARTVAIDPTSGDVTVVATGLGDGTVLRASALLDERMDGDWGPELRTPLELQASLFLPGEHLGLTANETFRDNVLYWLLEEPRSTDPVQKP